MREIKFRGKRVDNGEWVYGYYFEGFTGISYILVLHDHILQMTEFYEVDPSTVGQYTGLKEKNGKEIYEGDILKWKCSKSGDRKEKDYTVVLKWESHHYGLTIYDGGEKWVTNKSYWNEKDREVIGNIYENPELLKE